MRVLSWNVQWCRGVDGVVDPARIAAEARRIADPDVACFQEIASNFPELPGSRGEDEPALLERALPGYESLYGWAVDLPAHGGGRKRFGNLILSRVPVGRVMRHALPWPAAPQAPAMPRVLVEAEVQAEFGPLRIMTTHLEYYSRTHRAAQIARISELRAQQIAPRKRVGDPGPFEWQPGAEGALLCGDFNLPPDDALHRAVLDIGFVDAWQALHPGEPHPFTFRVHQREAGQSPYCCDFVFVTPDLVPRLRSIHVDSQNRSSDHQPVIIELR